MQILTFKERHLSTGTVVIAIMTENGEERNATITEVMEMLNAPQERRDVADS